MENIVEFVIGNLSKLIDVVPTKSLTIKYGDENDNKVPDVTVTVEFDSGKTWVFGPFDVPAADLGDLVDRVGKLA